MTYQIKSDVAEISTGLLLRFAVRMTEAVWFWQSLKVWIRSWSLCCASVRCSLLRMPRKQPV